MLPWRHDLSHLTHNVCAQTGTKSMAPERRQHGIINEMFSTVMPPCWPTDRAFFAAPWKDCGSRSFCLDRVSLHFYFCISLNCEWSSSRINYLYMGTPIQNRGREVWMFSEDADGYFRTSKSWWDQLLPGLSKMWAPKFVPSFGKKSPLRYLSYFWRKLSFGCSGCMGWRHFSLHWITSETLLMVQPTPEMQNAWVVA